MNNDDWIDKLSDAIQDAGGVDSSRESTRQWLPRLIADNVPFKRGVTYMPVPRCDTCKLWARSDPRQDGVCTMWKSDMIVVLTSADYGCVRWEAK